MPFFTIGNVILNFIDGAVAVPGNIGPGGGFLQFLQVNVFAGGHSAGMGGFYLLVGHSPVLRAAIRSAGGKRMICCLADFF